jgi:uncharacterized UPF0160 family protein
MRAITHNGDFHADDVFAAACLSIMHPGITFTRTRDAALFADADIVFDVGALYDPARGRFDHHQSGGAGKRENGVPYAAFGLVWKEYGERIAGSAEAAQRIEERLVEPIDAVDNGVAVSSPVIDGIYAYTVVDVIGSFAPEEPYQFDEAFLSAVSFAEGLLRREVARAARHVRLEAELMQEVEKNQSAEILVLERHYPTRVLIGTPVVYVVFPDVANGRWVLRAVPANEHGFAVKAPLPEAWAGKRDQELSAVTGVPDAVFCHNGRFIAITVSKESAIALAEAALAHHHAR